MTIDQIITWLCLALCAAQAVLIGVQAATITRLQGIIEDADRID